MKQTIKYFFTTWLLVVFFAAEAQDFTFSQFYEKPMLRNPALAGVFDGDVRVSGVFRNQWQSVTVPFQTSAAGVEIKFKGIGQNDWITGGLEIVYDVAGDIKLKRTQILPVFNYQIYMGGAHDAYLSWALMTGPVQSQFDPTKLKLDDQFVNGSYDPNNPTQQVFDRTGFTYWDFSSGVSYNDGINENVRYYTGIGVFHANRPRVSNYIDDNADSARLNLKWAANAGISIQTSDINSFTLFADYFRQGGNSQFLSGALYGIDIQDRGDDNEKLSIYLGGMYRWNDALIPVVKLNMYKLAIGMSYDVNISKLKTASQSRGGFELTMTYKASFTNRSPYLNQVKCRGIKAF